MMVQNVSYFALVLLVWLLSLGLRRPKAKQVLLLLASYAFYASWGNGFVFVLLASSLGNFWLGRLLRRNPTKARLGLGIAFNSLVLVLFKYLPGLTIALGGSASGSNWFTGLLIPVGISFWTFQALSYLFDLYREEELDPSLIEFSLYLSFWPTVLSGPVCRLTEMVPQFRSMRSPQWDHIAEGGRRILIGLFMKLVLARLLSEGLGSGEGVAYGFDQISQGWGGIDVWMLAIGFGLQLFFDFAGYSHIVIGTAMLFGLRLEENFDRPYLSTTPSEFWTRWHMSLSFWIRDYLFIPVATVRREFGWRLLALILSMTLFGLWHGATLTFIFWGLYHGGLLAGHRLLQRWGQRWNLPLPSYLVTAASWIVTFGMISLGWVLFRANSLQQALSMYAAVLSPGTYRSLALRPNFYIVTSLIVAAYFLYVALEATVSYLGSRNNLTRVLWLVSPVKYAAVLLLVIIWSKQESVFVYFQF